MSSHDHMILLIRNLLDTPLHVYKPLEPHQIGINQFVSLLLAHTLPMYSDSLLLPHQALALPSLVRLPSQCFQINFSDPGSTVPFCIIALACPLANMPYAGRYVSTYCTTSLSVGDTVLQSRMRSASIANEETRCTPAACMRRFAVSRMNSVVVPLASTFAKTEYLGQC
jgi:hypothetical protein